MRKKVLIHSLIQYMYYYKNTFIFTFSIMLVNLSIKTLLILHSESLNNHGFRLE